MSANPEWLYDVYISHSDADADRTWVEEWLLPRLERAGLRVAVGFRDLKIGEPIAVGIPRLIRASRRTLVVLTPSAVASQWNEFETLLVSTLDPSAQKRQLLPLQLEPCELPARIAALKLHCADFRREQKRTAAYHALENDIRDALDIPLPPSVGKTFDRDAWRVWLQRYRRETRRIAFALCVVGLALWMGLELPPFSQREGWQPIATFNTKEALHLTRLEDTLLISTEARTEKCASGDPGLWRSSDRGKTWAPVLRALLIEESEKTDRCIYAAISAFALSASSNVLYAATTAGNFTNTVGVLRLSQQGTQWERLGLPTLAGKNLSHIVVLERNTPAHLLVATGDSSPPAEHLFYRSRDDGATWEPLSKTQTCAPPRQADLYAVRPIKAMIAVNRTVYVGTREGLYASDDEGECWERVSGEATQFSYNALAAIPGTPNQILAFADDQNQASDRDGCRATRFVWELDRARGRVTQPLLCTALPISALYVDAASQTWYALNHGKGNMFRGTFESPGVELPNITQCILDFCLADLTSDFTAGPPLVLVRGALWGTRIYRYDVGKWYNTLGFANWDFCDPKKKGCQ